MPRKPITPIVKTLYLRKFGKILRLTVPADFVRQHKLKPGDAVFWVSGDNRAKLMFNAAATTEVTQIVNKELGVPHE